MAGSQKRYYVPQLDGLRFFAFLLVFVHHYKAPHEVFYQYPLLVVPLAKLQEFGWAGVDLFLVLSAFLITNLLLLEHERTGTLSLKDFYVRRSLRIWPLYYLMLFVGFFISPGLSGKFCTVAHQQLMNDHLLSYFVFLGNFSAGFHGYADSRFLAHLWTISLEEQFYLVWPVLLVLLINRRELLAGVLFFLIIISIFLRYRCFLVGYPPPFVWTNIFTRLDPLALGTLLALYRSKFESLGSGDAFKFLLGVFLVALPMFFPNIDEVSIHIVWQYLSIALGFCLLLDASLAGRVVLPHLLLTNKNVVWLGKLCYGLYVYHLIGINIGRKLLKGLNLPIGGELTWMLGFLMSMLITVILAYLSYSLYEKKFLSFKKRFTIVESRPT